MDCWRGVSVVCIGAGMGSLMIGCGAGLMLTIGLIVAAVKLRPGKGDKPLEDKH